MQNLYISTLKKFFFALRTDIRVRYINRLVFGISKQKVCVKRVCHVIFFVLRFDLLQFSIIFILFLGLFL